MVVVFDVAAVALDALAEAVVLSGDGGRQRQKGENSSELHLDLFGGGSVFVCFLLLLIFRYGLY